MQTIVHVIDSLGIGGAERLLQSTIGLMHQYEHVVCYLHQPSTLTKALSNSVVYCLNGSSNICLINAALQLRKIVGRHKPLCVHAHLLKSTWVTRVATKGLCPMIFSIHSTLSEDAFEGHKLSLLIERFTYTKRQIVIGVSKNVLNDYDNWVGLKGRSFVISNFVPHVFFLQSALHSKAKNALRLVAVGNIKTLKNYDRLVSAMALLRGENITLDIFGDGPLRNELQTKIDYKQVPVTLNGVVNQIELVLPEYDMLIMPSAHEGFGLAPAEAMAVGLPVLLSNLPVFRELFGAYPVYFDHSNPASIADAIRFASSNFPALKENAKGAKQFVFQQYSETRYKEQLQSVYKSVAALPDLL